MLPQGGNVPFSPRGIDHDVGGKATRYSVQAGKRMVVDELGPGYARAGRYPRPVVVGRALISNARQHVLHFGRVQTGRTGQGGAEQRHVRIYMGVVIDGQACRDFSHHVSTVGPRTSRWSDYDRRDEQQTAGFTRRTLLAEDTGKLLLCEINPTVVLCCTDAVWARQYKAQI